MVGRKKSKATVNTQSSRKTPKPNKDGKPNAGRKDSKPSTIIAERNEIADEVSDQDFVLIDAASTSQGQKRQRSLSESDDDAATKKQLKKRKSMSPLRHLVDSVATTTSVNNFQPNGATSFLKYQPTTWSPQYLYRLPYDIALSAIRNHGGEGIGRSEIGQYMGLDTSTKPGSRRTSQFIQTAALENKPYIGEFQKMEGKVRSIRYFWKQNEQPEQFEQLFAKFQQESGGPCPFKMGQVLKFPGQKLNTLRISDVTLRRLSLLLELANRHRVIVTSFRLVKMINEFELANGYKFMIDKKSLMKCLIALEREHLLHVFDSTVETEGVSYKVQILAHREIETVDDEEVRTAIHETLDEYNRQGRVFPSGQLKFIRFPKPKPGDETNDDENEEEKELSTISDDFDVNSITRNQRYALYRLQASKVCVRSNQKRRKDAADDEDNSADALRKGNEAMDVSICNSEFHIERTEEKPRSGTRVDKCAAYCYQTKAIRCMALHELVWQIVHGDAPEGLPNLYERFPPNIPYTQYVPPTYQKMPVYADDESSMMFVPPLPKFKDLQRGWFMMQDLVMAMPLSVATIISYITKKVKRERILQFLTDPIKRHTCIGDLPIDLREGIMADKKFLRKVEHMLLTLSALGLMALAENPDVKRFGAVHCSMFFVSTKGVLHDTSTSGKGYSTVTPPFDQYRKYFYEFDSQMEIALYWNHLRAIVQSTSLSFRFDCDVDVCSVPTGPPPNKRRFALGTFEKAPVTKPIREPIDLIQPVGPGDGCAGLDSGLFMHLSRHWEIHPRNNNMVSWFILRFRRLADFVRHEVESRVANLQRDWNNFVKSLMPSENELTRKNKMAARSGETSMYSTTRAKVNESRAPQNRKGNKKSKRPMDSVDMMSSKNRVYLRSRFSAKERDQLILIRAIGFYLNPVYRFWLDPTVLRDIMHEYVPESRTKTVQSLMAAGVREMVRPARLAYLQRIVRSLSSFPEMKQLRFELASTTLNTSESRAAFFKKAYSTATRLLFVDSNKLPHVSTTDTHFKKFLAAANVEVTPEAASTNSLPLRSRKPDCLAHIHHCVAVNILYSILLHNTEVAFSEVILEQCSPNVIQNTLQVLRSDGLVSRSRNADSQVPTTTAKNQAGLSYYFRTFFTHRFHPELVEQTGDVLKACDEAADSTTELEGDNLALVVLAASTYVDADNQDLEIEIDDQVINAFSAVDEQHSIKQIRYLESTDLHFEKMFVKHSKSNVLIPDQQLQLSQLLKFLDTSQPVSDCPLTIDEFLVLCKGSERKTVSSVYQAVKKSEAYGASLPEIQSGMKVSATHVAELLQRLVEAQLVVQVGVDTRRWTCASYAAAWCIEIGGRRCCPRPWVLPNGGICASTVRWFSETLLMKIVSNPGIPSKSLSQSFEFALQPIVIEELLEMLEMAKCIHVLEKNYKCTTFKSPFDEAPTYEKLKSMIPAVDGIERFSRLFGSVALLPSMIGGYCKPIEPRREPQMPEAAFAYGKNVDRRTGRLLADDEIADSDDDVSEDDLDRSVETDVDTTMSSMMYDESVAVELDPESHIL